MTRLSEHRRYSRMLLKAKPLLARARAGDTAARTELDAILKQHELTDEDIPPYRGLIATHAERKLIERAQKAETQTREQDAAYDQEQALLVLCPDSGIAHAEHLRRWRWLLEFSSDDPPTAKTYAHHEILSLLGHLCVGDDTDEALLIFADALDALKPSTNKAAKLLSAWDDACGVCRTIYADHGDEERFTNALVRVMSGELYIKQLKSLDTTRRPIVLPEHALCRQDGTVIATTLDEEEP
jgi:hypothetical protein